MYIDLRSLVEHLAALAVPCCAVTILAVIGAILFWSRRRRAVDDEEST
jgi:hypothetical protein